MKIFKWISLLLCIMLSQACETVEGEKENKEVDKTQLQLKSKEAKPISKGIIEKIKQDEQKIIKKMVDKLKEEEVAAKKLIETLKVDEKKIVSLVEESGDYFKGWVLFGYVLIVISFFILRLKVTVD